MPCRVDFYVLQNALHQDRFHISCKIIEKAWQKKHQIYILTDNPSQTEKINQLLWTFDENSFIPHELWQNNNTAFTQNNQTVYIGDTASTPPAAVFNDILVNLSCTIPDFFSNFQRIIEIVEENPESVKISREKYRYYQNNPNNQCELNTHRLSR